MKQFVALIAVCGCLAAGQVWSLEAVALPSDGGSNAASIAALNSQMSALNAMATAQGSVIQQLSGSVTSLTGVLNELETYVANTTCAGGQVVSEGGAMTCVGSTNGTNGENAAQKGCSASDIPNGGPNAWNMNIYKPALNTFHGAIIEHVYYLPACNDTNLNQAGEAHDQLQCNDGKWVVLSSRCWPG